MAMPWQQWLPAFLLLCITSPALLASTSTGTEAGPCHRHHHLVLLRHDPRGLRWLNEKWQAVTDPTHPDYRLYESRGEILRRLAPYSLVERQSIERWLSMHGWSVRGDYGDALRVDRWQCGKLHDRARDSQDLQGEELQLRSLHPPDTVVAVVPINASSFSRLATQRLPSAAVARPALPLGLSASTLRTMYSVPPTSAINATGLRVANWQGGGCKVFRADVQRFCRESGPGPSGGDACVQELDTSVAGAAPNASSGCIEAELDSEMLLVAAPTVTNVVGANAGSSFLAWAVDWFNSSGPMVPQIASVSWGGGEGGGAGATPSLNSSQMRLSVEFQKLGVLGRAVFWASGDGGVGGAAKVSKGRNVTAYNCSYDAVDNSEAPGTAARGEGFQPGFPATSPFVTACGGTEVNPALAQQQPTTTADRICAAVVQSRTSRGCVDGGLLTEAGAAGHGRRRDRGEIEVATSLNVSGFSSGGGFSWWFDRPSWQEAAVSEYLLAAGPSLPPARLYNSKGRGIPDVASAAGNLAILTNGEAWLGGGTSGAAPLWAGVWALATRVSLELSGRPLGPANPFLYHLAATRPECFHDIVHGDNKCPFGPLWQGNSCDCSTCAGFEATVGWDPVTGLGSPNVSCILAAVRQLPPPANPIRPVNG